MDDEPASLHIGQQDFEVEEETGYVTEPKEFLTGFRLSDIPADIIIKPVDRIEGHKWLPSAFRPSSEIVVEHLFPGGVMLLCSLREHAVQVE